MEEILPFLAGLAYMAYKVFDNYQKGQKEARERNPSQPYQQEAKETYSEWIEPEEIYVPEPVKVEEPVAERYREPKYVPSYKEPIVEKPVREHILKESGRSGIPQKVELQDPGMPVVEVVRKKAADSPLKYQFVASQEEEEFYSDYSDFDFKDAIIKEAILNRPQY